MIDSFLSELVFEDGKRPFNQRDFSVLQDQISGQESVFQTFKNSINQNAYIISGCDNLGDSGVVFLKDKVRFVEEFPGTINLTNGDTFYIESYDQEVTRIYQTNTGDEEKLAFVNHRARWVSTPTNPGTDGIDYIQFDFQGPNISDRFESGTKLNSSLFVQEQIGINNNIDSLSMLNHGNSDDDYTSLIFNARHKGSDEFEAKPSKRVSGIDYEFHNAPTSSVSEMTSSTLVFKSQINNFRRITGGRPEFGNVFKGQIYIDVGGTYTFYTNSSDGSTLDIDGSNVVNNDGVHGAAEVSGNITLSQGYHDIEVRYFRISNPILFEVFWELPSVISKQAIPDDVLFRNTKDVSIGATLDRQTNDFVIGMAEGDFNSSDLVDGSLMRMDYISKSTTLSTNLSVQGEGSFFISPNTGFNTFHTALELLNRPDDPSNIVNGFGTTLDFSTSRSDGSTRSGAKITSQIESGATTTGETFNLSISVRDDETFVTGLTVQSSSDVVFGRDIEARQIKSNFAGNDTVIRSAQDVLRGENRYGTIAVRGDFQRNYHGIQFADTEHDLMIRDDDKFIGFHHAGEGWSFMIGTGKASSDATYMRTRRHFDGTENYLMDWRDDWLRLGMYFNGSSWVNSGVGSPNGIYLNAMDGAGDGGSGGRVAIRSAQQNKALDVNGRIDINGYSSPGVWYRNGNSDWFVGSENSPSTSFRWYNGTTNVAELQLNGDFQIDGTFTPADIADKRTQTLNLTSTSSWWDGSLELTKTRAGIVYLESNGTLVKGGASGTLIGILPTDYRPKHSHRFIVEGRGILVSSASNDSVPVRLIIFSNGQMFAQDLEGPLNMNSSGVNLVYISVSFVAQNKN